MSFSQTVTDLAGLNAAIDGVDAAIVPGNYTISLGNTITETAPLHAINLQAGVSLVIDGGGFTLDGVNAQRGLFVYAGDVTVQNLTIQNTKAVGGAGGQGGGGGGGGLGGGLFIAGTNAGLTTGGTVTLDNVTFTDNSAAGGSGGVAGQAGGGGGLGGAGGRGSALGTSFGGAGGGGGIGGTGGGAFISANGSAGIIPGAAEAGAGGLFGPGGGVGGGQGGGGGAGHAFNGENKGGGGGGGGVQGSPGVNGSTGGVGGTGGAGGFGGGGGGSFNGFTGHNGGAGGFGGGGGAAFAGAVGGAGGFGGGGGGGSGSANGAAGFGAGVGSKGGAPNGGGGLGAGGDIFVQHGGSLIIEGGDLSGGTVSGGAAGGGNATAGQGYGDGIFLQGTQTLTLASTGTLTIDDVITDEQGSAATGGAGGIAITNNGTVVLGAANTYTGGTSLGGTATLEIAANASAGTGTVDFTGSGSTLRLDSATSEVASVDGFESGDTIHVVDLVPGSPGLITQTVTDWAVAGIDVAGTFDNLVAFTDGSTGSFVTVAPPGPIVTGVTASGDDVDTSGNGDLRAGKSITLTVSFDEVVNVVGTPTLSLNDGGTATFTGGDGTPDLIFDYTVGAGANTPDLTVTALNLTSATIKNGSGDDADTSGAVTNPPGILQIDTTVPAAPGTPDLAAADDFGNSTDNITGFIGLPTFSGTGEDGATVTLRNGLTEIGTGLVSGGTWSITANATLGEGDNAITATQTDLAGNVSGSSGTLTVTLDTVPPGPPSIPDLISAKDSGASNSDNITNVKQPIFSGTSEAFASVTLKDGGSTIGVGSADTNGDWSILPGSPLADGGHTITATQLDLATNGPSAPSGALTFTIDTTAPNAPSNPDLDAASDSGISNSDDLTNVLTPTITGVAETDSTVTLYDSDGTTELGTDIAAGGDWSITSAALLAGGHNLTAKAADAAGNVSTALAGLGLTIDTEPPIAIGLLASGLGITKDGDGHLKAGSLVTLTVSMSEPVTVAGGPPSGLLSSDGTATYVSGSGTDTLTYLYTVGAGENTSDLTVVSSSANGAIVRDLAGNDAVASPVTDPPGTLEIDTTVPTARATVTALSDDTGRNGSDFITKIAAQTVSGTFTGSLAAGEAIQVSTDGVVWTDATAGSGTWTAAITLPAIAGTLSTRTIDLAGNVLGGNSHGFTLDIGPPDTETAVTALSVDSGTSNTDFVTQTASQTVSGTFTGSVPGGGGIEVSADGTTWVDAVSGGGTWSASGIVLPAGPGTLLVRTFDAAGNAKGGTGHSFTLDNIAPTATIVVADTALKIGNTSLVTITFSESVSGFDNADLTIPNGALSAVTSTDGGVTWTATLTPTAGVTDATNLLTLDDALMTDAAGNTGTGSTDSNNYAVDTLASTLTIASDVPQLKVGETAAITFTFSEDPGASFTWDGTTGDVVVTGGTLGAISGSGLTRTATFTPTAGTATGSASITVASGLYTDTAGNTGGPGTTPTISIDTLAPTLAITSDVSQLKIGETAAITFTFSEDPGASFTWDGSSGDVVVTGGTLGAISGSGLTRTATFTPTAGTATGSASITVVSGLYTDTAGNTGGPGTTPAISIDTLAPTLAITSDVSQLKIGETAAITFTFSEDPGASFTWDGSSGDVAVAGGTLGAISGSGLTRTATFTPTAGTATGSASITVASGRYTDTAGNTGGPGTTPAVSIDTLAPTLTIASDVPQLKIGETAAITFTFSEDPGSSFTWDGTTGDVVVTGGTLGAISGSGLTRTATFTPTAGTATGSASITVASGLYTDTAGNTGGAGASPAVSIDTLAPALTITSDVLQLKVGETAAITFTFSEDPGASFTWDGTNGDVVVTGGTLGAISGSGLTRTATFTPTAGTATGSASITVASGRYTDTAGNTGGPGTTPAVSIDTLAPTLTIASDVSQLKIGETAAITFTFSEDPGASFTWDGSSGDVAVAGGTLGAISGSGLTRTATFTPTAGTATGSASITVASGRYTDTAGNTGGPGTTPAVSIDTLAPALTITSDVLQLKVGETAAITFTFSEDPGASFTWDGTNGDVVVTGGTLGAISGSGLTRTATFTPTAGTATGSASITVASGRYTDTAGNTGGPGTTPAVSIDTLAPTLTIASDVPQLKIGETAAITFTFSEDPGSSFTWDGSSGDVVVTGGTLGAISGSGLTRTATFTPTAGTATGSASITVASGLYTDTAGNTGGPGTTPAISIDTLAPTLTIASDVPQLKIGETAAITFTFSEDPGASFTWDGSSGDVVVSGGTLGAISGSGLTRTATFTPTAGTATGSASITVAAAKYTDAAGNTGGPGTTPTISIDTLAPTLAITSDVPQLKIGETAAITFTFSEDPGSSFTWDGTTGDVVVTGGTLGAISGSGLTRTATFTPTAGTATGSASITVAAAKYTDTAGNTGGPGTTPTISIDTLAPMLTIASDVPQLKIGETAAITFTFSEDPGASFTWNGTTGDVVVTGGTLGAISGSGLTRTATFTPTAGTATGSASITVASGRYTDTAGNAGGPGTTPVVSIDTLAPTLTITSDVLQLKVGETAAITFTFSEDPGASFTWDGTTGDVVVAGGTLGAISGSGLTRTATFTPTAGTATGSASITVAAAKYTDAAGNTGGPGTTPAISIDTLAPTLTIASDVPQLKIGETAAITFTFSEDPGASFTWDGSSGDVVVTGGTLGAISGSGLTRTATFTPTAGTATGSASITVASGRYTDTAGNAGGPGTTPTISIDTLAPTLAITSDVPQLKIGETAAITFTFSEDPGSSFTWNGSSGDVVVAGGTLGAISGSGLTRTATFTPTAGTATGSASISVAAAKYTDAAGNTGGPGTTPAISIDTLAPTLTIASDVSQLKIGETAAITFTFSEDPGASFTWDGSSGDVVVTGGTLGAISGSGLTRTATFTPTAGTATGSASITVAAAKYTDTAGNTGGPGTTPTISIDTLAPMLTIASDVPQLKIGETAAITFTFSEDPGASFTWDGTNGDVVVTGGTLGAISGSGLTRTATFTPTAGTATGTGSITVASGLYTDAAGNTGGAGSTPAISIDTLAPLPPSIPDLDSGSDSGISNSDRITNISTPTVTGTAEAGSTVRLYDTDATTVLGTATATGGTWSIIGSLLSAGEHTLTAKATDAAGNVSTASPGLGMTIDTAAPDAPVITSAPLTDNVTPVIAGTAEAGATVRVTVGGASYDAAAAEGAWSIDLGTAKPVSGTLTLDLNGANSVSATAIDRADNASASTPQALIIDTTLPVVTAVTASPADAIVGGNALVTLTLGFSEAVTVAGGTPTLTLSNGAIATYASGSGSSSLTFNYTVVGGQDIADLAVTEANLNGATIADGAGNNADLTGGASNPPGILDIQANSIAAFDVTVTQPVGATGRPYTGPVAGLQHEYINVTSNNLNVATSSPNWFIHSGSGDDAIAVSSGINVLDGGTGSNFLTGGSGADTFFLDNRGNSADTWSTIVNFHAGHDATIWGVTPADFNFNFQDNEGAPGFTGLTLHATAPGRSTASLTFAGFNRADLGSGRISQSSGTEPFSGSTYTVFHANT